MMIKRNYGTPSRIRRKTDDRLQVLAADVVVFCGLEIIVSCTSPRFVRLKMYRHVFFQITYRDKIAQINSNNTGRNSFRTFFFSRSAHTGNCVYGIHYYNTILSFGSVLRCLRRISLVRTILFFFLSILLYLVALSWRFFIST